MRHVIGARAQAAAAGLSHGLIVRETELRADWTRELGIQALYRRLAADDGRNALVLDDAIRCSAQVVVTTNLQDFPTRTLAPCAVEAEHPGTFLLHLPSLASWPGSSRASPVRRWRR